MRPNLPPIRRAPLGAIRGADIMLARVRRNAAAAKPEPRAAWRFALAAQLRRLARRLGNRALKARARADRRGSRLAFRVVVRAARRLEGLA